MQITPPVSSCECGALTIAVFGPPAHVHGCACTKCQRRSGSVMALSAWFLESDVQITGDYTRYYYTGAQDDALMAGFCPLCGSGKFFRTGDYLRGHTGIAVGNFADPTYLMPDHIHSQSPCLAGRTHWPHAAGRQLRTSHAPDFRNHPLPVRQLCLSDP